jgi:peptidoglycan hydrolase CwlO-like protein
LPPGLPPQDLLKEESDAALARLRQDVESKLATLRAAQAKHSSAAADFKTTRVQLQESKEELQTLKEKIQQGLSNLYHQARALHDHAPSSPP